MIGYDRLRLALVRRELVVGYPAGFAVYPDKRYLDKGRQETDIPDISSREASEMQRDIPELIAGP
jgi:hypothetical protein